MSDEIKKIKIKDLPHSASISDSDIFVESNTLETYKVTADDIAKYVSDHKHLTDKYVNHTSIGAADGIAPLDSNKKIDGTYVTYGSSDNTAYEGSAGKILEQNLDTHLLDDDAHGYDTKINNEIDRAKTAENEITTRLNALADSDAEVNQNAFSNVKVGNTTIAADSKTDTVTLVAGENITLTPDSANKKIIVSGIGGIVDPGDSVSFTQSLKSGAKIGTLTINGTDTDLYCQTDTNEIVADTEPTNQKVGGYWLKEY